MLKLYLASSDEAIYQMEQYTQKLVHDLGGTTKVIAAHEGLEILLGNDSEPKTWEETLLKA